MPAPINRIRIFVASPGDVTDERQRLGRVVDHLRTHVAAPYGLDLELVRWETHVHPGVGADAQDVVNPQIGTYDLFIGILWNRLGTPTQRAESGTREEFDQAYARWQADPTSLEIWVYFSDQPYTFRSPQELDQKAKVMAFQQELRDRKGLLVWTYKDPADFEEQVRGHLELFIPGHAPQADLATSPPVPTVSTEERGTRERGDDEILRQRYLREVWDACVNLKLTTVDIKTATGSREAAELALDAVFTDLDVLETSAREEIEALKERRTAAGPSRETERLPAMAALFKYPKLVLLGDPGSGKSTLVNFVALCLAGDGLGSVEVNRKRLGKAWKLPGLLPLRLILRDYAARGLPDDMGLWQFIQDELKAIRTSADQSLAACIPVIQSALDRQNGAMVLLDGVDEVPEAQRCRVRLKEKVEQFCRDFPHCRVLVTSRPYAYQDPEAWLGGFQVRTLADFSEEQVQTFIARWYNHVGQKDRALGPVNADRYAKQLQAAVKQNRRLAELAPRPLLLTLMASLHRWREGGSLPEKRQELYEASVRLLLDLWQRPKQVFDAQGRPAGIQYDVWKELGIGAEELRQALNQVAYEAHWRQPSLEGTHDIRARDLVGVLYERSDKAKTGPEADAGERRIVEYLTDRAGLLIERTQGQVYTFPHRTFQEYLAACYLADEDYPFLLAERLREDDGRWREACLLAAAKAATGTKASVWNLVAGFCPRDYVPSLQPAAPDWYAALRAAEALIETEQYLNVPERQRYLVERLQAWLAALVDRGQLPPRDRSAAGDVLARLGYRRLGVGLDANGLPDIVWRDVPVGEFTMGNTKKTDDMAYGNEAPQYREPMAAPYRIGKYPITNAQYEAFVRDGGYTERWRRCWTPTGWEWKGKREGPEKYGGAFDLPTHPVVMVTWYEAYAFAQWLGPKLGQSVSLPTEAQWEKAARGTDGRRYPWEGEITPEHANYAETGIGSTSAVGIFPQGASPYGALDMSGNAWEWCLTKWRNNYRSRADEDPEYEEDEARVVRGGSFIDYGRGVRCASRIGLDPNFLLRSTGFRVVASALPEGEKGLPEIHDAGL